MRRQRRSSELQEDFNGTRMYKDILIFLTNLYYKMCTRQQIIKNDTKQGSQTKFLDACDIHLQLVQLYSAMIQTMLSYYV